jgi:hypothetical protein
MIASDVVLLGMLDSVELVTTYSLTKYAPETLVTFVAIIVFGTTPGLGGIIGSGNLEKAAQVRNEIMSLTWLVVTVLGSTALLWNRTFVGLWVGAEHYAGSVATLLIMVVIIQFVLIRNDANIIDLTLDLRRKVLIGALSVVLSLVGAGLLVNVLDAGIAGLCLGFIAGRSILSVGYPLMVGRFLRASPYSQARGVLRPALVTVLLFPLAAKLSDAIAANTWFPARGWIELILAVGITFCVVFSLVFHAGLSREQRRHILRRVQLVVTVAPDALV